MTASEFEQSFFQENFRIALMPSRRGALEQQLQDGSAARYLRHYMPVVEERERLERFTEAFQLSDDLAEAMDLAAEWLLPPLPSEPAPVALVVFAMDGRGYDPIVLDVLAAAAFSQSQDPPVVRRGA